MDAHAHISRCGQFVALVSGSIFQVHSLLSPEDASPISSVQYDLPRIFFRHKKLDNWSSYKPEMSVSIIDWEHVCIGLSTKVAVCVSDGDTCLVLIFVLGEEQPIVIEADALGVERLQWLPFYLEGSSAYLNSTLLAIFTKFGLELRVYSIAHTHMLFSIPKPLINQIFIRPGNSGVWSVIVSSFHDKNSLQKLLRDDRSSSWPSLLHFYTDGITCSLLAALRLDFDPSPQANFVWSESAKWLLYFDTHHSLYAHRLAVFNLLGVHDRDVEDITDHVSQATRSLNYEPDSIETRIAGISPKVTWGNSDSIDYILVIPTKTKSFLNIRVSDVTSMSQSVIHRLDLNAGQAWLVLPTPVKTLQYRKVSTLPLTRSLSWSRVSSFGSSHVLAADNCVVILASGAGLQFEVLTTILHSQPLIDSKRLGNGHHVLAFADHIALQSPAGMEVITFTDWRYSEIVMIENHEKLVISVVESSSSGTTWSQIDHDLSERNRAVKQFHRDETGTDGKETRQRLGQGGREAERLMNTAVSRPVSDSSGMREEITDTFQAQKRRRR